MKALVLVENGVLELQERDIYPPGKGQYLIRVNAAGVCSSDLLRAFGNGAYRYPLVMGHEVAGQVVEAGPGVSRLQVGQKVVVFPLVPCRTCRSCGERRWNRCEAYDYYGSRRDGGFQEFLAVDEWNLVPVPGELADGLVCLCEPVAVAVHAAKRLPPGGRGRWVLVLGAGFLGIVAALILKREFDYRNVILTDRNDWKLERGRRLGIMTLALSEVVAGGQRFDYVLEAAGAGETYHHSLRLAAPGACVVWMGNLHGNLIMPKEEVSSILRRELRIEGVWNSDYQNGTDDDWSEALQLIGANPWFQELVTSRVPLEVLPEAMQTLHRLKAKHQPHSTMKMVAVVSRGAGGDLAGT